MNELKSSEFENQKTVKRHRTSNIRFTIYSLLIIVGSLIFLAISCKIGYVEPSVGFVDELAKLTAYAFILGIIFLLGWRRMPRHKKAIAFALIFCAIASYRSVRLLNEAANAKNALKKVVSVFDDVRANRKISGNEINEKLYGEMTPFVRLWADWASEVQKDCLAMNNEIDKCNLTSIFDARTLTQPTLLLKCLSDYEKADNLLRNCEEKIVIQYEDLPTRIRNSDLPQDLKERALSGFNRAKDEALQNISALFRVRNSFVSEGKKLLVFMKDRQSRCKYQNNKIVFEFQEDGDEFGSYMERLLSLTKQEDYWLEKIQEEVLMKAKEIEGLIK